jgi:hypothetical protein
MRSDSPPLPDPFRPGPKSKRARILMPIALSVAALAVFLFLFWPADPGRKGARGHSGQGSGQGPAGSSATQEGSSPVGGGSRGQSSGKGEGWWYKDKEAKPEKDGDQWWYKDKSEGAGSKKSAGGDSRSPVGGQ